jgi:hypothetical protein
MRAVALLKINSFTMLGAFAASTYLISNFMCISFLANINHNPFFVKRVLSCAKELQAFPSFITVDFWELSDVLQVVHIINAKGIGVV